MKKIISVFLALLTAFGSVCPVFAVENFAGLSKERVIDIVRALDIMRGDQNGNLNLESKVTRAEFVKMAVAASTYKDDANVKVAFSTFPDVSPEHWAAGYIRTAVNAGWIKGYLDGSFKPFGNVKLEEAVTIVLKLLGYTDGDFIGFYPDGQLAKYSSLNLDSEIGAVRGEELSRLDCMYLIYNMLCTYTKSGNAYCTTLGHAADAFGNIDYDALIQEDKKGPFIVTDLSSWQNDAGINEKYTVYKDGKVISASSVEKFNVVYTSPDFLSAWVYDDIEFGVIEKLTYTNATLSGITLSGVTYKPVPKKDYSGKLMAGEFEEDTYAAILLGEKGEVVEAYKMQEPFVVTSAESLGYIPEKVYKNGAESDISLITEKGLVYSCPELSLVYFYDTDASGVLGAVSPSVDDPQSVTVGGTVYQLGENAKKLFENKKVLAENDFITVYTGKDGKLEYAELADVYDTEIYEDMGLTYETLVAQTLKGPEIVQGDGWKNKLGFDAESAAYYLDGNLVDAGVITDYDVIYYSPAFKAVWIVSDRVTGVLEDILPNTMAPTSVKVAGAEYAIETSRASIMFAGKGEFSEGDSVTLLLGSKGVVSAIAPDLYSANFIGVTTDIAKKEYTDKNGMAAEDYFLSVQSFDGKTHSIKADNKNFPKNTLVSVTYYNGNPTVKKLSSEYRDISELKSAIKAGKISPDAVLIDYFGANYIRTYAARLSEITLTKDNVAYYNFDGDGNIDYLVLKDATGDMHSYGVIMNFKGSYNFLTSAKNSSISDYVTAPIGMVGVKYNNLGEAQKITPLTEKTVTAIDAKTVKYPGNSAKLWDSVECYVLEQKLFKVSKNEDTSDTKLGDVISKVSLDRIISLLAEDKYAIKCGIDSTGTVRVLVACKK